jgi:large subunit ribosomal protein L14e
MKIAGREAGKYCVVLTKAKDNFVQITGPKVLTGVKRRRCNVEHLEPTEYMIKIKEEETDNVVISTLKKEGFFSKLGLKMPSPEVIKGSKKESKKETSKKEEKSESKTIKIAIPKVRKKEQESKEEKEKTKKKTKKTKKKASKKTTKKKPRKTSKTKKKGKSKKK